MNPDIWGNLPPDLIELIAHFADIDSRRALGFLPRRLVVPSFNIKIPKEYRSGHVFVVKFDSGIELICWPYEHLFYGTKWIINKNTTSSSFTKNEFIEISRNHWKVDSETYTHPDFNEDGSFKRSRPVDIK
jgi:hypothetical protein